MPNFTSKTTENYLVQVDAQKSHLTVTSLDTGDETSKDNN
jgi:type IV secretory pathway component VirB8